MVRPIRPCHHPKPTPDELPRPQFDSDDEDLAIYTPGLQPAPRNNPYGPTNATSAATAGTSLGNGHRSSPSLDPFSNTRGVYDPYGQSQNPASYGGGQAANRFGTAVDLSTQGIGRYDVDDDYKPF